MFQAGFSFRYISKKLKCSRHTIKKYLNANKDAACSPVLISGIDYYRDYIVKALSQGMCRSNLYRELEKQGLHCGKTAAYDYMRHLSEIYDIEVSIGKDRTPYQNEKRNKILKYDYISRKTVFQFLWMGVPLNARYLSYLFMTYPVIKALYYFINEWRQIFRLGYQSLLYSFFDKYETSELRLIADFVKGLIKDQEAVENAVSSPLSNGFVEGTNSKLKMLKRTMYGRCGRKLLSAKLMLDLSN